MTLQKVKIVDRIEVLENGCVQVRIATRIIEDDLMLNQSFHRHVITPGDDYSGEDSRVKAICAAAHTPEVIAAYKNTLSSSD